MLEDVKPHADELVRRLRAKNALIGVIGLGYVGLPLCLAFGEAGARVLGFDIDSEKTAVINEGKSYIKHISTSEVARLRANGRLEATADMARLAEVDAVLICVPTPITKHLEPDLSYVIGTTEIIAKHLRPGQLIVLESTTYPGTTDEVVKPILEKSGLKAGQDFLLAFSPEREDPANPNHTTSTIPKVVGGDNAHSLEAAQALYEIFVERTVPVSSTDTAEAVKITENIFRAVNIALVNELKLVYKEMGIDIFEVIDAAKTKPFGFMPFYPGPGIGGHCIPVDPFYLTWRAREFELSTWFNELAGQINSSKPERVLTDLTKALDMRFQKSLNGARVLLLGMAYKKNVDDMRESPSLRLLEKLEARGALVEFHDPFVPEIPFSREHPELEGRRSVDVSADRILTYDAVLIATDHDGVDYPEIAASAHLVVDTRNACARHGVSSENVILA